MKKKEYLGEEDNGENWSNNKKKKENKRVNKGKSPKEYSFWERTEIPKMGKQLPKWVTD